jgi:AcrR family transcriptional regulator
VPRAGLTTDAVVSEAARLADELGYDGLTLAAVAERFGVKQPSLYKHVDGVDGVRRRLAALAVRELGSSLGDAAVGRARADALRAMAAAYRGYARRHPGRYAATVRADPENDELQAASENVLRVLNAVLAGYGIRGDDAIDAARTVRSALHGFVVLEQSGGFGLPRDIDRSFVRMVDALDVALAGWR